MQILRLLPFLSDYRRMVLQEIGLWRFSGKIWYFLLRRWRAWSLAWSEPVDWQWRTPDAPLDRSPLLGRWFAGSRIDISAELGQANIDAVLKRAEEARNGYFHVNGKAISIYEAPCNGRWDVDPISGQTWPQTNVFLPIVEAPGDVRFPWELGRLHQLLWFGQAWRLTRDQKWLDASERQIQEVFSAGPFEHGIQWCDGLQLGVRIFSLVGVADLAYDAPEAFHRFLARAVVATKDALLRQISPASELTNNHVIGEVSGIVLAGLYLDDAVILEKGLNRLELELERQIYADGVPYEGSVPYIRFDLEFLLLIIQALKGGGRLAPNWLLERTKRISGALAAIVAFDGSVPPIGDGDCARVVRLDGEPYLVVNETLHLAGVLFGEAWAPQKSTEGFSLWVMGERGTLRPDLEKQNVHLKQSGLVHLNRGKLDIWLDCGPTGLGLGGPGGHGHNDTTAIVVHYDGKAILHDPGWYTYYGDPEMRDYLRSTAAHNTITIDGQEQARLGSLFEILDDCKPTPVRMRERSGLFQLACGHLGFGRFDKDVYYRRFVTIANNGHWRIRVTDLVRSSQRLNVTGHLSGPSDWRKDEAGFAVSTVARLELLRYLNSVEDSKSPYSNVTGVLNTGSGVNWSFEERQNGAKDRFCYISSWELSIGDGV